MAYGRLTSSTIPAPSGSRTDFTYVLAGTLADLKTVANGGYINNTVTRTGVVCPADFILSLSSTGASILSFGWVKYVPTTGEYEINVKLAAWTAGFTLYALFGDASVVTYQGGARGSEWDSNTRAAFPLPDGTTLSGLDFTSFARDLTLVGPPSAVAGKIDGGAGFNGSTQYGYTSTVGTANTSGFTISAWVKATSTAGEQIFIQNGTDDVAGNPNGYGLEIESGNWKVLYSGVARIDSGVAANTSWHHLALSNIAGVSQIYIDGVAVGSTFSTTPITPVSTVSIGAQVVNSGTHTFQRQFNGSADLGKVVSAGRSAGWILDEYSNQNNPSTFGASTPIVSAAPVGLPLMGCQ